MSILTVPRLCLCNFVVGTVCVLFSLCYGRQVITERDKYKLELPHISVTFDDYGRAAEEVKIDYEGLSRHYAIITPLHDNWVENTRKGIKREIYRESPTFAYHTSDFEAAQLLEVTDGFKETLKDFEKNLKRKDFEKCLYLDGYFPRFLRGFYYLCASVRNSPAVLPREGRVDERDYEPGLASPLSVKRIDQWRSQKDHIIKLRMATRELIFQIERWQDKDLDNRQRKDSGFFDTKFRDAYALFIQIYFNKNGSNAPDSSWLRKE